MPKGRVLSAGERETIAELHRAGASGREIAKKLERSKTVVLNFLRDPAQYGQIKRSGRKRALSSEDERRLYVALFRRPPPPGVAHSQRAAGCSSGEEDVAIEEPPTNKSAEQIKREFNLPLSVRRIQQLLSEWRTQARKQLDSHMQQAESAGSEGGDEEDNRSLEQEAPAGEEGSSLTTGPDQLASQGTDTSGGVETPRVDPLVSADAMLSIETGDDAKREDQGVPELTEPPKLEDESCLSALAIDEGSGFPELQIQMALSDDKSGESGSAAEDGASDPPLPLLSDAVAAGHDNADVDAVRC